MSRRGHVALFACLTLLAACGGGGGGGGGNPGTPSNPNDPNVPVTPPAGSALRVAGGLSAPKGTTVQLASALVAPGGAETDCSSEAVWSSSDPAVATIAGRTATAVAEGLTTVTATYGGLRTSTLLVVTAARVVGIAVAPAQGELPLGFQEQLTATATLTDGTTADVTQDAELAWTSSDPAIVAVSNAAGSRGVATANQTGAATITAALAGVAPATVTRTVVAATLQSIAISQPATSVPLGTTVQFRATGAFSDGATVDVTPSATWTSSDDAAVAFDPGNPPGLAATLKVTGGATVTATIGAVSQTTTLAVTAPAVTSIAISPLSPTIVAGDTLQLTGQATYSDGTVLDGVALTGWASSVPAVATVSSTGLLAGVAPGTATITANEGDFTARTQVTVTAAATPVLSYLSLSKGSVKGGVQNVVATVHLTAPAAADTVVALESNSAFAQVPASKTVTIPAGAATATFDVTTSSPAPARKARATIAATLGDSTKTATLNVRR